MAVLNDNKKYLFSNTSNSSRSTVISHSYDLIELGNCDRTIRNYSNNPDGFEHVRSSNYKFEVARTSV